MSTVLQRLLGLKVRRYVADDGWWCAHCHGPSLWAYHGKRVRLVGYEHKLDCPTLKGG